MSSPEDFLARWSRRKRQAAQEVDARTPDAPAGTAKSEAAAESAAASEQPSTASGAVVEPSIEPSAPAFDPASLPSLESITAETDIRAFLVPGVPAELTRAALRRVWTADPNIRDFIGLSENSWDFNAPGSMGGFGPLEMTDELRRQIMRMVGRGLTEERADRPAPTPPEALRDEGSAGMPLKSGGPSADLPMRPSQEHVGMSPEELAGSELPTGQAELAGQQQDHVAMQNQVVTDDETKSPVKRLHGGALPK